MSQEADGMEQGPLDRRKEADKEERQRWRDRERHGERETGDRERDEERHRVQGERWTETALALSLPRTLAPWLPGPARAHRKRLSQEVACLF